MALSAVTFMPHRLLLSTSVRRLTLSPISSLSGNFPSRDPLHLSFVRGNSTLGVIKQPHAGDTDIEKPLSMPDFHDGQIAYESKSTSELLRSILVLRLCQIRTLAKNGETYLGWASKMFGAKLTDSIVRMTIFKHFCGGETEEGIKPVIGELRKHGIGGILDYAAESDVKPDTPAGEYNQPARTYDYESEAVCDQRVEIFRSCIHSVRNVTPEGFAALKVTALGNPLLLERMSTAIVEAKKLFLKFDKNGDGVVSRKEFEQGYRMFFTDGDTKIPRLLEYLDPECTGNVDYITWSKLLSPSDMPQLTASCKEQGPLARATLSSTELDLMAAMHERAHLLAKEASECGTRLLIDAEQARFQPAIDNLVLELQQEYNNTAKVPAPIIFNTYQCYLKDVLERLKTDVERSERFSYHFGAKLVRGAYHESENELAKEQGSPSPIHDSEEDTHKCYNEAVERLLRLSVASDNALEIMFATHNQESIEKAVTLMNHLSIDKERPTVHFAQLYGMADNLTYTLGKHGFRAYKYVPYGAVKEVMPYLMRRAKENSSLLGNTATEIKLLENELKRRIHIETR